MAHFQGQTVSFGEGKSFPVPGKSYIATSSNTYPPSALRILKLTGGMRSGDPKIISNELVRSKKPINQEKKKVSWYFLDVKWSDVYNMYVYMMFIS